MRTFSFLVVMGLAFVPRFCGADAYPSTPVVPKIAADDVFGSKLFRDVAAMLGSQATTQSGKLAKLDEIEQSLGGEPLPLVSALGRMDLPKALVDGEDAFLGGLDSASFWQGIASTTDEASLLMSGIMIYKAMPSALSFSRMKARAATANSTLVDLLRLQAFISAPPGAKLAGSPSRADWEALHKSTNPCYRLIALETFDSVEQGPSELLALYRECLFGACSFLEVRALAAIKNNNDCREEVAKMLDEYAATNPANDGTLPGLRNPFREPGTSAKELAVAVRATLRSVSASAGAASPSTTSPTPTPTVITAPKQADATKSAPMLANNAPPESTPWSIVVVLIAAAVGLLWLVLKRRAK